MLAQRAHNNNQFVLETSPAYILPPSCTPQRDLGNNNLQELEKDTFASLGAVEKL